MKKTISLFVVLLMMCSLGACSNTSDNQVETEEPKQETQHPEEPVIEQSMVDLFIEEYNATASIPITDLIEVDVTDQESGHYRTEFRLSAFEGSIAKTGKIGNIVIDIVNCGWQKDELRIYADGITPEQAAEIVRYAAPIMDPNVPDEELQDVISYLNGTNDYHNGYFGNLCMTFNDIRGELMLRTD